MANDDLGSVVPIDSVKDFKIADGNPDVRGWEVLASDGQTIGTVKNLLVDTRVMKVRYLEMATAAGQGGGRRVLIPIGYARLDRGSDRVLVDELRSTDVAGLPSYGNQPLTRDDETTLRQRFDTSYSTPPVAHNDFYEHKHFDDQRFYGRRPADTPDATRMTLSEEQLRIGKREQHRGEVGVRKHVETEHVREEVPVTREEVTIERVQVTGEVSLETQVSGDEIRIPLVEEELVIEKRKVVREMLVIRKQRVTETRVVEEDLRKERVNVSREGDVSVRED